MMSDPNANPQIGAGLGMGKQTMADGATLKPGAVPASAPAGATRH